MYCPDSFQYTNQLNFFANKVFLELTDLSDQKQ